MRRRLLFLCLFVFLVGCSLESSSDSLVSDNVSDGVEEVVGVVGPGGCAGSACGVFFNDNPEESQVWCDENPEQCEILKEGDAGAGLPSPGDCGNDCEVYCDANQEACEQWCSQNFAKNPELCEFMVLGEERGEPRQGDGVWEKDELRLYVKDGEGVLTSQKREVIIRTITSEKKVGQAFLGWNAALEELNRLYPDNIVPDRIVMVGSESDADIVIGVHSAKEYCCDLAGLPVKGTERSSIDDMFAKLRSDVDIYNIVRMDVGFLEDITMHELGHTLGLFGHVTDRRNDLMSLISPGRGIKKANLDDLYVKYRDRVIESVEETQERDEGVRDRIVSPPD
jgi:hypothetical protein